MNEKQDFDLKAMENAVKTCIEKHYPTLKGSIIPKRDIEKIEAEYHKLRADFLSNPNVAKDFKNDAHGPTREDAAAIYLDGKSKR